MKKLLQYSCILAGCLLLAGCAEENLHIFWRDPIARTRTTERRTITLTDSFEFCPAHVTPRYRFPAGRYVATYEDQDGIYFPAPAKIIEKRVGVSFECDGGLYRSKGPSPRWRAYFTYHGSGDIVETADLPQAFVTAEGRLFFVQPPFASTQQHLTTRSSEQRLAVGSVPSSGLDLASLCR